ncbi:MAG: hypothetical protein A2V90_03690 [Gammaproteobacteria bacterium RBG_16_57_12]|nr:MAG: hypothetical protein A2V90_03690 [Gammaproteobacteria bacterium RBG_16_57_12]
MVLNGFMSPGIDDKVIPTLQVEEIPSEPLEKLDADDLPPILSSRVDPAHDWPSEHLLPEDDAPEAFAEPGRVHLLNLLSYLLDYGDQIALVTGVAGLGKTYMLRQLQIRLGINWRLCVADAAQHVDDRQFFLGIAQGLGLSPVALRDDWQAALGKYLADVSRSMMTPVVAIDNAQHLSEKRLAILLQLYSDSMIDGRATLRLVLFGEKSLSALFEKEKEPGSRLSFREFELHPFTREQSDEYIRSRLKVSNDLREDLLSDAWLEWAYKKTGGIPSAINEFLKEKTAPVNPAASRFNLPRLSKGILAAAALVLLAVLAVWLYQEKSTSLTEAPRERVALDLPPAQEPIEQAMPEAAKDESVAAGASVPTAADAVQPTLVAEATQMQTDTRPESSPPEPAIPAVEVSAVKPQHETIPSTAPQVQPSVTVVIPPRPAETLQAEEPVNREAWLLRQSRTSYTLQLMALNDEGAVKKVIMDHGLKSPVAYYHKRRDGQDWYVLVFGVYATPDKARAAHERLPKALQKNKPFPRRIGDIHQEINALRQ